MADEIDIGVMLKAMMDKMVTSEDIEKLSKAIDEQKEAQQKEIDDLKEQIRLTNMALQQVASYSLTTEQSMNSIQDLAKKELGAENCTAYVVDPANGELFKTDENNIREYIDDDKKKQIKTTDILHSANVWAKNSEEISNHKDPMYMQIVGKSGATYTVTSNLSGTYNLNNKVALPYAETIKEIARQEKDAGFSINDVTSAVAFPFYSKYHDLIATMVAEDISGVVELDALSHINVQNGMFKMKVDRDNTEYVATHDKLTGLLNRRGAEIVFNKNIYDNIHQKPAAIIMADIDRFKMFNDICGHDVGDAVLKKVAEIIQSHVRPGDVVIRQGGEEIIVAIDGNEINGLKRAEQIRQAIFETPLKISSDTYEKILQYEKNAAEAAKKGDASVEPVPFRYNENEVFMSVSMGVAEIEPSEYPNVNRADFYKAVENNTVKLADSALYYSKNHGRNQVNSQYYQGVACDKILDATDITVTKFAPHSEFNALGNSLFVPDSTVIAQMDAQYRDKNGINYTLWSEIKTEGFAEGTFKGEPFSSKDELSPELKNALRSLNMQDIEFTSMPEYILKSEVHLTDDSGKHLDRWAFHEPLQHPERAFTPMETFDFSITEKSLMRNYLLTLTDEMIQIISADREKNMQNAIDKREADEARFDKVAADFEADPFDDKEESDPSVPTDDVPLGDDF